MTSSRGRILLFAGLMGIVAAASAPSALAAVVQNPANGHFYECVNVGGSEQTSGISWVDANVAANARTFNGIRGRLAAIFSQQENDFIRDSVLTCENSGGESWIGGNQGVWVTGQPFAYTNFDPINLPDSEPTDADDLCTQMQTDGLWDNSHCDDEGDRANVYVVEYFRASVVPAMSPGAMLMLALLAGMAGLLALRKKAARS